MRRFTLSFTAALLTFLIGVSAVALWLIGRSRPGESVKVPAANEKPALPLVIPTAELLEPSEELPETKAVRLAEEFIARNGYTDLPAEKDKLTYETIEWEGNVEGILKSRHDTLERKAYGVRHGGKGTKDGWTVVFRYKKRFGDSLDNTGRAVTMDEDFQHLRVEHQDFFLTGVDKKL